MTARYVSSKVGNLLLRSGRIESVRIGGPDIEDQTAIEDQTTFAATLQAAAASDPDAVRALAEEFRPRLVANARRRGASEPEAMANSVLFEAFRNLPSFRGDNVRSFRAYLYKIMKHQVADEFRRQSSRPNLTSGSSQAIDELVDQSSTGFEDTVVGADSIDDLLSHLTDDQREVVEMRVLSGLSVRETASQTGRSVAAVKAMQHRALASLRSVLIAAAAIVVAVLAVRSVANAGDTPIVIENAPVEQPDGGADAEQSLQVDVPTLEVDADAEIDTGTVDTGRVDTSEVDIGEADTIAGPDIEAQIGTSPTTNVAVSPGGPTATYAQIEAGAPPEYVFEVPGEYLGEFLRQNPTVRWWSQDHDAQTITALAEPEITGTTISITPSGDDDTDLIADAANRAGPGGAVVGNGQPFKVANLAAREGVTYRDMPMVPASSPIGQMVTVNQPDVTFINSPIDMLNREVTNGYYVFDGGDRFALVDGGVSNQVNRLGNQGSAMVRINQGADDVYIVGNVFENGFAADQGTSIRGIHYSGPDRGYTPSGGIIALNRFENLQSSEEANDADGFVAQGFDLNNQFSKRLLFLANTGVDAGKRLIKAQSGGIDAHSNSNWWKTADGPGGRRVTLTHYDVQRVSNVRLTNNYARTDHTNPNSESYFMQVFTHQPESNVVLKHNIYEHNEAADGRAPYVFRLSGREGASDLDWPTNSQFSSNVLRGTGSVRFVYWFKDGPHPTGDGFDHSNRVELEDTNGTYRTR